MTAHTPTITAPWYQQLSLISNWHQQLASDSSLLGCAVADNLYEDIEPVALLEARVNDASQREFQVQWPDAEESSWVGFLGMSNVQHCIY